MTTEQSLTNQAIKKACVFALLTIPTAISIFVAIEVKAMGDVAIGAFNSAPQVVCFDESVCAIEVRGRWFRIDGVISMEDTVPEEYKLQNMVDIEIDPLVIE
jgi:hypothetical protein